MRPALFIQFIFIFSFYTTFAQFYLHSDFYIAPDTELHITAPTTTFVSGQGSKFSAEYKLKLLVYYEEFQYVQDAIAREKQLKRWHRGWKINLIEKSNPNWMDLWKPLME